MISTDEEECIDRHPPPLEYISRPPSPIIPKKIYQDYVICEVLSSMEAEYIDRHPPLEYICRPASPIMPKKSSGLRNLRGAIVDRGGVHRQAGDGWAVPPGPG